VTTSVLSLMITSLRHSAIVFLAYTKPLFSRPLHATGGLGRTSTLDDLECHLADHEAALPVLAPAERLVEGGFTEGWGGCGLDAPRSRAVS
jgi:hypothetical protein